MTQTTETAACEREIHGAFRKARGAISRATFHSICASHGADAATVQVILEGEGMTVKKTKPGRKSPDDLYEIELSKVYPRH